MWGGGRFFLLATSKGLSPRFYIYSMQLEGWDEMQKSLSYCS